MYNRLKYSLVFLSVLSLFSWVVLRIDYQIFSSEGEKIPVSAISKAMDTSKVLIFGEEHNDSIAHELELAILKELYKIHGKNVVLSLEMFDHDVQYIMDEYLSGLIKESYFRKDAKVWNNYKDYRPLVEFAKDKQLEVICANAPFRYANLVSHRGVDTLQLISNYSKKSLPLLPFPMASDAYRTHLENVLGDYARVNDSTGYDLLKGQALWNSSMAYWITQTLEKRPKSKVFHINGKLHSDYKLGVPEMLDYYSRGVLSKTIVISSSKTERLPKKLTPDQQVKAEILIFTK